MNKIRDKDKSLSHEQCDFFKENGYLLLDQFFRDEEVNLLSQEADRMKQVESPGRVMESDSGAVRALNGSHLESAVFDRLTKLDHLLNIAKKLLNDEVYIYQFKVNFKEAFEGEIWEWHQDFSFWHYEDGMPSARAVNIGIFLDEVTEFNGPLVLIPGTQKLGLIEDKDDQNSEKEKDWQSDFNAKLKFSLEREQIQSMADKGDMVAPKGKSGSILVFDPNTVHGSAPNISPMGRKLLIVTYNSVSNAPNISRLWRPEFLVGRDVRPLQTVGDSLFV